MTQFYDLPNEIIDQVTAYLDLIEYHSLRISSTQFNFPLEPHLHWDAYLESTKAIYRRRFLPMAIPLLNDVYGPRVELVMAHKHYEIVCQSIRSKQFNPEIKRNILLMSLTQCVPQVLELLLMDPEVLINENYYLLKTIKKHLPTDCLQLLLTHTQLDPTADSNILVKTACKVGSEKHLELILKLPNVNPGADDNYSICYAAGMGYYGCIALLLSHPLVDPTARDHEPLMVAAANGHYQCLLLLLGDSRVDAGARNQSALKLALLNGHTRCLRLLEANLST
ncbi:hypothetical protein HDV02_000287 [Globomyces sp. JEL0801]|nr:hypothetical protein HDV02_000287 [Globomyces sp. JEL0801]